MSSTFRRIRRNRTILNRRLVVESLENRNLLAGNVSASVSGGNLIIRGDNVDNGVVISQTGDGSYLVTGIDTAGGATTINGDPDATLSGVTGNFDIDLRKGDDILVLARNLDDLDLIAAEAEDECGLTLGFGGGGGTGDAESLTVPRSLFIRTGDGADQVALYANVGKVGSIDTGNQDDIVFVDDSTFGDDLLIQTGKGSDTTCVVESTINDLLSIQTGDGNDEVAAHGDVSTGHTLIIAGSGNDTVNLGSVVDTTPETDFDFYADREIVVDTGNGNDDVVLTNFVAGTSEGTAGAGWVTVVTGSGNDEAELEDFAVDGVVVDTGSGNDGTPNASSPITVQDGTITHNLVLVTGPGNDVAAVSNVSAHDAVVDAGAGNDDVSLIGLLLQGDLVLVLGAGADTASLDEVTVGRNAVIDAGSGNDEVTITDSHVDNGRLTVVMGSGNDTLAITGSTASKATLLGGSGTDTFSNDLDITSNGKNGDFEVREFEIFTSSL